MHEPLNSPHGENRSTTPFEPWNLVITTYTLFLHACGFQENLHGRPQL